MFRTEEQKRGVLRRNAVGQVAYDMRREAETLFAKASPPGDRAAKRKANACRSELRQMIDAAQRCTNAGEIVALLRNSGGEAHEAGPLLKRAAEWAAAMESECERQAQARDAALKALRADVKSGDLAATVAAMRKVAELTRKGAGVGFEDPDPELQGRIRQREERAALAAAVAATLAAVSGVPDLIRATADAIEAVPGRIDRLAERLDAIEAGLAEATAEARAKRWNEVNRDWLETTQPTARSLISEIRGAACNGEIDDAEAGLKRLEGLLEAGAPMRFGDGGAVDLAELVPTAGGEAPPNAVARH